MDAANPPTRPPATGDPIIRPVFHGRIKINIEINWMQRALITGILFSSAKYSIPLVHWYTQRLSPDNPHYACLRFLTGSTPLYIMQHHGLNSRKVGQYILDILTGLQWSIWQKGRGNQPFDCLDNPHYACHRFLTGSTPLYIMQHHGVNSRKVGQYILDILTGSQWSIWRKGRGNQQFDCLA